MINTKENQIEIEDQNGPIPARFKLKPLELIALFLIAGLLLNSFFEVSFKIQKRSNGAPPSTINLVNSNRDDQALEKLVLPAQGVTLPVKWGDLGTQLTKTGVIDRGKFEALYQQRGGLDQETQKLLNDTNNGNLKINASNSSVLLNLLWALGLGNENAVLTQGEMQNPQYGGAGNFASTGGWTLSTETTMDHYAKHPLVSLTSTQQELVERVSKNIYRPCCGNSTHFPDCNHGMAMLGLLELMAAQGVSEQDMYGVALKVNSYWFPNNYLTVAKYFKTKGTDWNKVDPKEVLGFNYSSSQGYKQVLTQVEPQTSKNSGGGCGV